MHPHTLVPLLTVLAIPHTTSAQVTRLTEIPFISGNAGVGEMVFGLFLLAITIAGVLAVVKLVIAGVKYMMSDVVTTKQMALSDIKGAILGLLLILSTILLVNLINPDIADTDIDLPTLVYEVPDEEEGEGDNCAQVADPDQGQTCEMVTCEVLAENSWNTALKGAAFGAGAGSILPGWGTFSGIVAGGLAGYVANVGGNAASCATVCGWYNGVHENGVCTYAVEEFDRVAAEVDSLVELEEELLANELERRIENDDDIAGTHYFCSPQCLENLLEGKSQDERAGIQQDFFEDCIHEFDGQFEVVDVGGVASAWVCFETT